MMMLLMRILSMKQWSIPYLELLAKQKQDDNQSIGIQDSQGDSCEVTYPQLSCLPKLNHLQYVLTASLATTTVMAVGLYWFQAKLVYPSDYPEGSRKSQYDRGPICDRAVFWNSLLLHRILIYLYNHSRSQSIWHLQDPIHSSNPHNPRSNPNPSLLDPRQTCLRTKENRWTLAWSRETWWWWWI